MAKGSSKAGLKARIGAGAAGFVIAAAVFGTIMGAAKAQAQGLSGAPMDDPAKTEAIKPASLAWSIPQAAGDALTADDPHLIKKEHQRYLAWAAVAGLLSSFVALIGANRLMQILASFGKTMGKATARAARAPVKAAKATARATARVLKKPGRWMLTVVGLTVFALTGIAFLDVQWEAGLALGAGAGAATVWGWRKSSDTIGKALAPLRRKKAAVPATE